MKKWVNRLSAGIVVSSMLVLSACGGGGNQAAPSTAQPEAPKEQAADSNIKERTIKAGIGLNEDHPQGQGLKKFAELVAEKSGGKIEVQNFYAAQLGDDQKMTEALKGGLQEITIPSTSPLVGTVKEYAIYDFPFLFNTGEEADKVLDGPVGQQLLDKLPEHGLIGLTYWENGFRNLTNSKRPVEKAEDFQGLKIRTMQNEVHLEAFAKLGANPTPMAFSEVFTALESKTVDGQENPLATIESNKFFEVQPYLSMTQHVYTPFVFLVSKKFWDQLSDEEKAILKDSAIEAGKYQRELNRSVNGEALERLKAAGMQVNEVTAEEKAKMNEIIKPVIDKFAVEIGEDLVKQLYAEIENARK